MKIRLIRNEASKIKYNHFLWTLICYIKMKLFVSICNKKKKKIKSKIKINEKKNRTEPKTRKKKIKIEMFVVLVEKPK